MNAMAEPIGPVAGIMFDVDGTLILSDRKLGQYEVLPGAVALLEELQRRDFPFLVLTNGSAYPAAEQAAKLRAIGLPVADDRMFTPNSVAAHLFKARGIERVMVLGQESVRTALERLGIVALPPGATDVQAVYAAWHPQCTMDDIHSACDALYAGAAFFTASDVPFFASRGGRAYGYSCAIAGALARVTGLEPEVTGKPSRHAMDFVAERLGVPVGQVAVIGDDPRVEIEMARLGGAIGIGVTSGTASGRDWEDQPPERRPHRVIANLAEFAPLGLV